MVGVTAPGIVFNGHNIRKIENTDLERRVDTQYQRIKQHFTVN